MTKSDRPTFPLIDGQRGLATRRQLMTAGFTRSAISHALHEDWQLPITGVVAPHRGPLDADTRLAAAALWAGPHAVLTGGVALDRHGLPGASRSEALFLVPSTARDRSAGPVRSVRTTREIVVVKEFECVQMVSLERALVDHALRQEPSARDLKALTLAALQRRLSSVDRITDELERSWTRGGEPIREALDSFAKGAWSLPEDALATLFSTASEVRDGLYNKEISTLDQSIIGTPDVFFPAAGVAGQVHSRQHHSGYAEDGTDLWSLTVEKDAVFAEHDIIVIGVTPRSLAKRPQAVLDRFRNVVSRNLGRTYGPVVVDGVIHGLGDGKTETAS